MTADATPILTRELLDELKQRWTRQQAPVLRLLRPGLSDEQMDRITEPLELRLPPEARVWWGWHDGAEPIGPRLDRAMTGTGWTYLALHEAVDEAQFQRRIDHDVNAQDRGLYPYVPMWTASWIPIVDSLGGDVIAVDCADHAAASPVYSKHSEGGVAGAGPYVPSLGTMITWWIEALDDGSLAHDAEAQKWKYDESRLDTERERRGVL